MEISPNHYANPYLFNVDAVENNNVAKPLESSFQNMPPPHNPVKPLESATLPLYEKQLTVQLQTNNQYKKLLLDLLSKVIEEERMLEEELTHVREHLMTSSLSSNNNLVQTQENLPLPINSIQPADESSLFDVLKAHWKSFNPPSYPKLSDLEASLLQDNALILDSTVLLDFEQNNEINNNALEPHSPVSAAETAPHNRDDTLVVAREAFRRLNAAQQKGKYSKKKDSSSAPKDEPWKKSIVRFSLSSEKKKKRSSKK